jgi:hypothetical protein
VRGEDQENFHGGSLCSGVNAPMVCGGEPLGL